MKVNFYTFDKKYNSTKRPTGTGTEYNCVLKTSSGVISPTIELQLGLSSNPSAFNYCYISSYARYYWVKEWTFVGHLWIATLNVDVLATWKTYIGDTNMYIYRSSNASNGNIMDKKYPTTGVVTYRTESISALAKSFNDGWFVVGVYGEDVNTATMSYYRFSATRFRNFVEEIFTYCVTNGSWDGVGVRLRNAVFNVSDYIRCCYWLPDNPSVPTGEPLASIKVGSISVPATCHPLLFSTSGYTIKKQTRVSIPKHPQARTRGSYCNLAPYSRYRLVYLPFGSMELDTTKLQGASYLLFTIEIDGITGEGILTVTTQTKDANNVYHDIANILVRKAKYGVDIPIATASINVPSIASSLAGAGISATHGNLFSTVVSGIVSVAELFTPDIDTVSDAKSGLLGLDYDKNGLIGQFFELVPEDNNSNGRPLCDIRKVSNLSGYIEGESHDFSAPATITEMEEIRQFIDNGFYYE